MEPTLLCYKCNEFAYLAVTCERCSLNYCQDCYASLGSTCQKCNVVHSCQVNHEIRQRIIRCKDCEKAYDHKNTIIHQNLCPKSKVKCQICSSRFLREEIKLHMYTTHYQKLLERFGVPVYRISRLNY